MNSIALLIPVVIIIGAIVLFGFTKRELMLRIVSEEDSEYYYAKVLIEKRFMSYTYNKRWEKYREYPIGVIYFQSYEQAYKHLSVNHKIVN